MRSRADSSRLTVPPLTRFAGLCFLVGWTLLSGCQRSDFPEISAGEFAGLLKAESVQAITAESGPQDPKRPERGWTFRLKFSPPSEASGGSPPFEFQLRPLKDGRIAVEFSGFLPSEISLSATGEGCFRGDSEESRDLQVCIQPDSLQVDSLQEPRPFSLSLVALKSAALPPLEAPSSFTIPAVIDRARHQSFESRIQVERVLQSRLRARQAYLNLLPSLNLWAGVRLATAQDFLSIINLAGSLTPFLFPSRWIQAAAGSHAARADTYGAQALRTDVGFIAQTLALSYLRDREIVGQLDEELRLVRPLRNELAAREKLGLLEPGSSDELTLAVGQLELTRQALLGSLAQSRATLAESMGFMNPEAVQEIETEALGSEGAFAGPAENLDEAQALALTRSFELKQLDSLIRSAELEKISRFFMWLDPSGDPSTNLGFGLPNSVAVAQARVAELKITRERLQAAVLQKLAESRNRLEAERKYQTLLETQRVRQTERLDRLMNRMKLGLQVPIADLLRAVQGRVQVDMDAIRSRYQVRAAEALWDRSLMVGPHTAP